MEPGACQDDGWGEGQELPRSTPDVRVGGGGPRDLPLQPPGLLPRHHAPPCQVSKKATHTTTLHNHAKSSPASLSCRIIEKYNSNKLHFFHREDKLHKFAFVVSKEKLKKGLCKGVKLDVYFPGFPTLKHIEHTVCILFIIEIYENEKANSNCKENFREYN